MSVSKHIIIILISVFFIALLVLHEMSCGKTSPKINRTQVNPAVPSTNGFMLFFAAFMVSYLIFEILKRFRISTPHAAYIVMASYIWGCITFYSTTLILFGDLMYTSPRDISYIYNTIVIFQLPFMLDVPIFIKTLPQILVISIPVGLTTAIIVGMMTNLIMTREWTISIAFIFGLVIMPTYSKTVALILQQETTKTKQINVLLDGEAVFTFIVADVVYKIMAGTFVGILTKWSHCVTVGIRLIGMGLLTGYLGSLFVIYMMRKMSKDNLSVYLIVFVSPFFIYAFSNVYISGCGSVSVMVVGIMLAQERSSLDKDVEKFMIDVWNVAGFAANVLVCLVVVMICAVHVAPPITWNEYIQAILLYISYYAVRFLSYLLYSPIISRLGYGIDFKSMCVCVLGGLKTAYSLQMVIICKELLNNVQADEFLFSCVSIYFLSLILNGSFLRTILDFLGVTKISLARNANMDNCIRHMLEKREETIAVLKMDRFLSDADWAAVLAGTTIQHPYRMDLNLEDQDNELFEGYRFTFCPDCKNEIPDKPTAKQFKDMRREARIRVLKAKKMSYSRQFENGMISKECIRILCQAVELAMDSEEAVIEVEDLHKRFTEENYFRRFIRRRLEKVEAAQKQLHRKYRRPRTYWKRVCYHLIVTSESRRFDKIMLVVVIIHLILMCSELYYHPMAWRSKSEALEHTINTDHFFLVGKFIFCTFYIIEFVIRVLAYSFRYIWRDGVRIYFKSIWRCIDFIVILGCIGNLIMYATQHISPQPMGLRESRHVFDVLSILRALRLLYIVDIFYPIIIKALDKASNRKLVFTYELGKSYTTGESEILDMLPYVIDDVKIRDEIKQKIDSDRILITQLLGIVQKDRPWIAITVKTKQAIRTVLCSMNQAINHLKTSGWVDAHEVEKLQINMSNLYRRINTIKIVEPSPPKVIFKEVAWMAGDEAVIDFLFENVMSKIFEPGTTVFEEGVIADGIYIVVTGLLKLIYYPDDKIIENMLDYGMLPIVDYVVGTKFEDACTDYIVSGNCIGELGTLTERPYNCRITSEAQTQVYFLSKSIMKRAAVLNPDPILGLECRIWKAIGIRVALPLLLATPAYQALSQDQVKYALERAFVPDLSRYKIFAVTDMIEDIILIEGVAADFNSRETFTAPCCLPRTVQKLILPKSSQMNVTIDLETKLLIIPAKDVDEIDVMMLAEETCDIVESGSSRTLVSSSLTRRNRHKRFRMRGLDISKSRKRKRHRHEDSRSLSTGTTTLTGDDGSMFFQDNTSHVTSIDISPYDDDSEEKETTKYSLASQRESKTSSGSRFASSRGSKASLVKIGDLEKDEGKDETESSVLRKHPMRHPSSAKSVQKDPGSAKSVHKDSGSTKSVRKDPGSTKSVHKDQSTRFFV